MDTKQRLENTLEIKSLLEARRKWLKRELLASALGLATVLGIGYYASQLPEKNITSNAIYEHLTVPPIEPSEEDPYKYVVPKPISENPHHYIPNKSF